MLVRCLVGLRYSFAIGIATVAVMLAVGCSLGLPAGCSRPGSPSLFARGNGDRAACFLRNLARQPATVPA